MSKPPGNKGQIYIGTAGSTAATQLTNVEDLNEGSEPERVETTVRGDGSTIPIVSEAVVAIKADVSWSMFENTSDANLTTLRAAARAGTLIAIRTKAHASGLGCDADFYLGVTHEMTLKGPNKYNFTASPSDELRAILVNT